MSKRKSKGGAASKVGAVAAPGSDGASPEAKLADAADAAAPSLVPDERSGEVAEPAWPPREAAPAEPSAVEASEPGPADARAAEPTAVDASAPATAEESASGAARPPKVELPETDAALPAEEMGFSNSTLHWLADGDAARPSTGSYPITTPSFDPTAPVAGRRRAVLVVGGAAIVAFALAGTLYFKGSGQRIEPAATAPEPARELVTRAEAALDANRMGEAFDLAKLALVADPRFADAHFIVATCERARNDVAAARDEYRRYLALAPLGTHAEAARTALAALPP